MASSDVERVKGEIKDLLHPDGKIAKSSPYRWPSVRDFDELSLGDHTCYYRFPYYKHGIIITKIRNGSTVTQLRYRLSRKEIDTEDIQYSNGKFYVLDKGSKSKINLLKAIYDGPCFGSDTAVQRAFIRWGEKLYHPITNFARAFPRWCKTGKGGLTAINQVQLNQSREVVHWIGNLARGDHIAFDRGSYFHHQMVLSTNPKENQVEVIHYTSSKGKSRKGHIKKEFITRHKEEGTLYRLNYRKHTESEADLVVLRAELMMKEGQSYNVLNQNCEHLVTWCKTGVWQSGQVQALAERVMAQVSALGIKLGPQVVTRILSECFGGFVDIFASINVHISGKPVDIISCLIFCIVDIAYNVYDIRKKYKKGELRGDALQEEMFKRAIRCLVVDGSVVVGNIIGQIVCPIPLLGAFLGGLCGLALGDVINFLIQKLVAFIKSKQAKCLWEDNLERLRNRATSLGKKIEEMPCMSHCDTSCIGLA